MSVYKNQNRVIKPIIKQSKQNTKYTPQQPALDIDSQNIEFLRDDSISSKPLHTDPSKAYLIEAISNKPWKILGNLSKSLYDDRFKIGNNSKRNLPFFKKPKFSNANASAVQFTTNPTLYLPDLLKKEDKLTDLKFLTKVYKSEIGSKTFKFYNITNKGNETNFQELEDKFKSLGRRFNTECKTYEKKCKEAQKEKTMNRFTKKTYELAVRYEKQLNDKKLNENLQKSRMEFLSTLKKGSKGRRLDFVDLPERTAVRKNMNFLDFDRGCLFDMLKENLKKY